MRMKSKVVRIAWTAGLGFAPLLSSAVADRPDAAFTVTADRSDAIYRCGEPATFTVTLAKEGVPVREGLVEAAFDNYGATPVGERRTFDLAKENPFRVTATLAAPGFLRLTVRAAIPQPATSDPQPSNSVLRSVLSRSVGFEPEKIRQETPEPDDFDRFWDEAKRRFDADVPVDIKTEFIPEKSTGGYNCYRVSAATYGRCVHGWLSEPKNAGPGSCGVRVKVPGAGIGDRDVTTMKDTICLTMNVHSYAQPEGSGAEADARRNDAYRAENRKYGAPHGVDRYFHAGISKSREDYFYYPVILGINRTVDWVAKNPKADLRRFVYCGTSQGGAFGCILAALNTHFTKAGILVPAMTDTLAGADGRQTGWPRILAAHAKNGGAEGVRKWMPYFEACNFAARIRCPVRFLVGFADPTCPPHCVYAAYNQVAVADKAILNGIGMTHSASAPWTDEIAAWLAEPPAAKKSAPRDTYVPASVPKARVANIHLSHIHRGGGRLERPDNTLETFLWCWGNGSALECDCRKTADGVGIMLHDRTLARTGRGIPEDFARKDVSTELSWADIADVDVGSYLSPAYASQRIPRTDAVMQAMAGHPKWLLFVDEKGAGPAAIAASARRAGVVSQVYYTGKSVKNAVEWRRQVPGGKTLVWIGGWPWSHARSEVRRVEAHFLRIRDEIAAAGWTNAVSAVSLHTYYNTDYAEPFIPSTAFLKTYIAEFRAHGIPVCSIPFEGGETEEVYYRLFNLGCDGFSSDYPSVAFRVIRDLLSKAGNMVQ